MEQAQSIEGTLTADQFFVWLETQSKKYELIAGQPVLMAGASIAHDAIVTNAIRVIGNQLLGKPCRPRSADIAIRVADDQVRYPDLSVDCGKPSSTAREAGEPVLVIEVESKSTSMVDAVDKLEEYQSIASMQYIVLVATEKHRVRFYFRDEHGTWCNQVLIGRDSAIVMPLIGLIVTLGELYFDI